MLLGVRAVLAESFERIHRSNLVGMGVLPLQFQPGDTAASLGLTGRETFSITGLADGLVAALLRAPWSRSATWRPAATARKPLRGDRPPGRPDRSRVLPPGRHPPRRAPPPRQRGLGAEGAHAAIDVQWPQPASGWAPRARRRRAPERAHSQVRERGAKGANAAIESSGLDRLPDGRRGQGGAEHRSERTRKCVSEERKGPTPPSTSSQAGHEEAPGGGPRASSRRRRNRFVWCCDAPSAPTVTPRPIRVQARFTGTARVTVRPSATDPLIVPSSWTPPSSPKTLSLSRLTRPMLLTLCS